MKVVRLFLLIITITFSLNVASQTVYTTKSGEKYHKTNCRYLKYSKKETTIKKVKAIGYVACKICKPTAHNTRSTADGNLSSNKLKTQNKPVIKKVSASQCTGKTKSDSRCKRRTKNTNGRCYQH